MVVCACAPFQVDNRGYTAKGVRKGHKRAAVKYLSDGTQLRTNLH